MGTLLGAILTVDEPEIYVATMDMDETMGTNTTYRDVAMQSDPEIEAQTIWKADSSMKQVEPSQKRRRLM